MARSEFYVASIKMRRFVKNSSPIRRFFLTSRDVSRVLEPCFFVHIRLTIAGVYRIIQYRCVMGMFRMKTESIERKSR